MAAIGSSRSAYKPLADTASTSSYHSRVEFSPRSSVDMGRIGVRCTTADEEKHQGCSDLVASFLAADRARSLSPAGGDSAPSALSSAASPRPSKFGRVKARLKGKPSPRKEALKAEAERRAMACEEYGVSYENCSNILPSDSHSLRSANFYHENFGELEAYAEGHEWRIDLSAAEVVQGGTKVAGWLEELSRLGVWEMADPAKASLDETEPGPLPGRDSRYGDIRLYESY